MKATKAARSPRLNAWSARNATSRSVCDTSSSLLHGVAVPVDDEAVDDADRVAQSPLRLHSRAARRAGDAHVLDQPAAAGVTHAEDLDAEVLPRRVDRVPVPLAYAVVAAVELGQVGEAPVVLPDDLRRHGGEECVDIAAVERRVRPPGDVHVRRPHV